MKRVARIVDVTPRDGLQNMKVVSSKAKMEIIRLLTLAGVSHIEAASFVKLKTMADHRAIANSIGVSNLDLQHSPKYSCLVLNRRGMENAIDSGFRRVNMNISLSETFLKKNTGLSFDQAMVQTTSMAEIARSNECVSRFYISNITECPYEGVQNPDRVAELGRRLHDLDPNATLVLSDTAGTATPSQIEKVVEALVENGVKVERLAAHYHDTHGRAIENIDHSLDLGIREFDTALGGIGGCPSVPNSNPNACTEKTVALLTDRGYDTGVDALALVRAREYVCGLLGI